VSGHFLPVCFLEKLPPMLEFLASADFLPSIVVKNQFKKNHHIVPFGSFEVLKSILFDILTVP
jgi:hypothetical protein